MTGPEPDEFAASEAGRPGAVQPPQSPPESPAGQQYPPGSSGLGTGFAPSYLQSVGAPEYLQASDTLRLTPPVAGGPRHRRRAGPVVSAIGVAAVVGLLIVLATAGLRSERQNARTAAEVVATAARQASTVSSLSATMTLSAGSGQTVSASIRERRSPMLISLSMTADTDGTPVPIYGIIADDALYMKFGATSGLPTSMAGKWIKIPLTDIGAGSPFPSGFGEYDATSQAKMLADLQDVQATGAQRVDGVQTTMYSGTLDLAKAISGLPAAQRSEILSLFTGNVSVTVWIDGSGLLRKFAETETVSGHPISVVFTIRSYNQPVNVTIPSGSQVYDLPAGSSLDS